MFAVTDPRTFELGAEFASGILVGIYSCLLVITLWRPIVAGRLSIIAWILITTYGLILCRVAVGYRILGRTLYNTNGQSGPLDSIDYVLLALRFGFSFIATSLSDGLFCWRLYVIRSRSLRIVLLPVGLLALNALAFTAIVVIDSLLAYRPNDRLAAINFQLFIAVQGVVVVYTCYITAFMAVHLWSVGRAVNNISSFEKPKRNRYCTAISALIQIGFIQTTTRIVTILLAVAVDPTLLPAAGGVTLTINGISVTLLVLVSGSTLRTPSTSTPR
ncbi:hypothetical protein FRB95_006625 [Tulasnella sp. JGI-2019a]|nr:hypothetical protein FRB95_006625 [Tulasnella sp. JGI-2019a]